MNINLIWAGLAIVIVGVLWYISSLDSRPDDGVVKVGALFGQSGFSAFAGEVSRNGFILAVEDAELDPNDFVIEDHGSDLTAAVSAAQKLISTDGVDVIIGPDWAEFSAVTVPLSRTEQVLFVSPWLTSDGPSFDSPYFFSATPTEHAQIARMLEHMSAHGITRLAINFTDNAYSTALIGTLKDEIKNNFTSISIVYEARSKQDEADFRTEISKLKAADPQAVLFSAATSLTSSAFMKQAAQLALSTPIYMTGAAVSVLAADDRSSGVFDEVLYTTTQDYARAAEFAAKYKARFGVEPAALSGATAYDMTTLVLQAVKSGATNADDVTEYLKKVNGYVGYSNLITFGADRHVQSPIVEVRKIVGLESQVVK